MSDSREDSPDWLQCFQAPKRSYLALSSDSDHSPVNSLTREDDIDIKQEEQAVESSQLSKDDQNEDTGFVDSGDDSPVPKLPKSKSSKATKLDFGEDSPVTEPSKSNSPKARGKTETRKRKGNQVGPLKEEILEKDGESRVSSRLPLVMSEKVQRSKALVECEGESIDMSGDVGAVGRVVITDASSGDPEMLLDLKGTIYRTRIVPSRTFCVVSFNQAEAKIEAVMNDFIQLQPVSNVYEAETMVEGTLEGFTFDSDEEADKIPKPNASQGDQNNGADELNNGKANGKAKKASGTPRKKTKAAAKAPKKVQRRTQGPKKAKSSKK